MKFSSATIIILILIITIILGTYIYFNFFRTEPEYIDPTSTIGNVKIQPAEALELAKPYLEEHATDKWNDSPLETHIVKYKNSYYVMQTNYPAKTFKYYMQPAVKIDVQTGEIKFTEKK